MFSFQEKLVREKKTKIMAQALEEADKYCNSRETGQVSLIQWFLFQL
jgi:hypothetical protein